MTCFCRSTTNMATSKIIKPTEEKPTDFEMDIATVGIVFQLSYMSTRSLDGR